jgi:hypothetical protein
MAQHRQWQNRPPNTLQDPSSFFSGQYNQQQAPGNAWQGQSFTNQNWQPQQYPPANPTWKNQPAANPAWQNQPTANSTWPNSQYPTSSWKNSNNNIYPSQWPNTTAQNPNWNQNWQRPMGINNQPMGMAPQTQPTLQAPLQLPQNPQSQLHPQLPAQPHPNPNNRPTQLIQIMENGEGETNSVGCNELRLRSGRIISPEENNVSQEQENEKQPAITPSTVVITEEIEQGGNTVESQDPDKDATPSPPFPERLMIEKPTVYPNFDIVGELKNLYIKIPLLQALQDIPIYAKTIKELCGRNPVRKIKDPSSTVRVVGALSDLILGRQEPVKYADLGNPIVTVQIQGCSFPNTLVDLGAAINILTMETCNTLGFDSFEPTAIMLQLADRSVVRPVGTLHDIAISVDSWEYPVDFLIINPRSGLEGHPLILGRPWLATTDAYIGCRMGNMTIARGGITKNLILYPPAKPSPTFVYPQLPPPRYPEKDLRAPLTLEEALRLKNQLEDDVISGFINSPATVSNPTCQMLQVVLDCEAQGDLLEDLMEQQIPTTTVHNNKSVEIAPGRSLNINANLDEQQQQKLIQVLSKYQQAFAWEYSDMKGIDPQLCTHHIYIEKDARPIRQPQRRLNPHLRDIVKEELQKLLDVDFIYPISDSRWVSPLVIVPKKNGKW